MDLVANIQFLKEIERHPELYHRTKPYHGRKEVKKKIWKKVSQKFNITVTESKEKWRNLRTSFLKSLKDAASGDSVIIKKPYYLKEAMQFLLPYIRAPSLTSGTLPEVATPVLDVPDLPAQEVDIVEEYEDADQTGMQSLQQPQPSTSSSASPTKKNAKRAMVQDSITKYLSPKKTCLEPKQRLVTNQPEPQECLTTHQSEPKQRLVTDQSEPKQRLVSDQLEPIQRIVTDQSEPKQRLVNDQYEATDETGILSSRQPRPSTSFSASPTKKRTIQRMSSGDLTNNVSPKKMCPESKQRLVTDQSKPKQRLVTDQSEPKQRLVTAQSEPMQRLVTGQSEPKQRLVTDQSEPKKCLVTDQSGPKLRIVTDQSEPQECLVTDQSLQSLFNDQPEPKQHLVTDRLEPKQRPVTDQSEALQRIVTDQESLRKFLESLLPDLMALSPKNLLNFKISTLKLIGELS